MIFLGDFSFAKIILKITVLHGKKRRARCLTGLKTLNNVLLPNVFTVVNNIGRTMWAAKHCSILFSPILHCFYVCFYCIVFTFTKGGVLGGGGLTPPPTFLELIYSENWVRHSENDGNNSITKF